MNTIIDDIKCDVVIITKKQNIKDVQPYYLKGYRHFGENKVQELLSKVEFFTDVHWHFVGRIQSNKIKTIIKHCELIHSVSTLKHLKLIDSEANKINKIQKILIQVNILNQNSKSGVLIDEFDNFYNITKQLPNIDILGIMVMGCKESRVKTDLIFSTAANLKKVYSFKVLSMGMSNDYNIAIKNGSTMLRLGSILFED